VRCSRKFSATRPLTAILIVAGFCSWNNVRAADESLAPPAPLTQSASPGSTGSAVLTLAAAERAHDLGLPSIAAEIYRQLRDVPGADRAALSLALVSALLDSGDASAAEKVLAEMPEPHEAAWHLRAGLAALQLRKREVAQAEWDIIKADDVPFADRAWYWFLTGALYDTVPYRDGATIAKANQYYTNAELAATTELARARFQLAGEQVRMSLLANPSESALRQVRETYENFKGRTLGHDSAKSYAVMLASLGRRSEAATFLERVLVTVPAQERAARDEMRFVLGLIGERGKGGAGRNALNQLLESGQNLVRERQALQLLAEASRDEPARGEFRKDLTKWIASKPPHPVLESLYFYRAQLALSDKDYVRAEEDANALLKQFPLSPLRVHALTMLTQSAWEQRRYRAAAEHARKARAEMGASSNVAQVPTLSDAASTPVTKIVPVVVSPRVRADLGVLEAEASFRAGDYRTAADAYAALLRERPAELEPKRIGELMFQRVLAEIKAPSGEPGKVLDELEHDPAFDVENRWQAEWNLARALQLQGEAGVKEAFARLNSLLREPSADAAALKPDLRARMAWLRARLSFENGEPAETIRLVDSLLKSPFEVEPALKTEIASVLMLLKARAEFEVERETVAVETLKQLRADYPKTDAAISSYLIEAEHYAAQDKIDDARNRLIMLTDNPDPHYKSSPYVPYALYRLALLSERLGREENLKEANQRIEDLVKSPATAADPTLLFAARLRQGDILRKLNQFPQAQQAYEDLVNRYPRRPDVVLAQLALADCHNVQSSGEDPAHATHADTAQLLFEQLRDRVDAPADVRVEAGYKLGALLARRGKKDQAARVWWTDVVSPFLIDQPKRFEREAKRPYWLARTLCDLGDLQEKSGRLEEAKSAYLLVLEKRLPFGEAIARARLQQLGVRPAKSGE
jgi:TolA-binding protein